MERWLHVVLDLDGTLIDEERNYRPHIRSFLTTLFETCASVSIWTAGSHLHHVLAMFERDELCKKSDFLHCWDRTRCSRVYAQEGLFSTRPLLVKRLRKMWKRSPLTRDNVLVVDDTVSTYRENYGNAVPIATWSMDKENDEALLFLAKRIQDLATGSPRSVRCIDKTRWTL